MPLAQCKSKLAALSRGDLLALLGLLLFAFLVHEEQVFSSRAFYTEDVKSVFGPSRAIVADSLLAGEIPFWNPLSFAGAPFYGNPENAVFYPFTAIFLVLPLVPALKASLLFHTILACWLAFLCFRVAFRVRPLGAFLGALVFAYSSYYPFHAVHHRDVVAVPWVPLAFLLADRIFALRGRRALAAAGGLGLTLGVQFLGGAPQTSLLTFSLVGLVLAWKGGALALERRFGEAVRGVALGGAGAAIGVGIAAIQILPTTTLVAESYRSAGVTWEFASYLSLFPPQGAVTLVFPYALGFWHDGWWASGQAHETLLYVGILPLLLFFVAWRCRDRMTGTTLLSFVAGLSLILAFGKWTPLYRFLYEFVPGYGSLRVPARFGLIFCFAMAGITAIGVEALSAGVPRAERVRRTIRRFAVVGLTALGLGLLWLLVFPDSFVDLGLAAAERAKGAELFAERHGLYEDFLRGIVTSLSGTCLGRPGWQLASGTLIALSLLSVRHALRGGRLALPALSAVLVLDLFLFSFAMPIRHTVPDAEVNRVTPLVAFLQEEVGDARIDERRCESLKWNRNVPYGLRAVEGRNLSIYPMVRYAEFLRDLDTDHPENLDLLRVRFLLRGPGEEAPPAEYPLVFADAGERVYLNRDIRPPAWLEGTGAGEVTLERFGRQEIVYRVRSDGPALLVTSERWYPGWRAFADGRERPAVPAHGILRAVALEGGEEEVVFRYREERFAEGRSITVLSLATAIVLLLFGLIRRRGPSKGEGL